MTTNQYEHWDGTDLPYIPTDPTPSGDIELHRDFDSDVDPITYEVIRHSLWNITRDHGNTIENLAVSPVTIEVRDFQTGILTEDAEFVLFGPYLQYFAGTMDLATSWILENRGEDPGIEPGDVFLQNDPWVGTCHQPDVVLIAPVFHDGQVFCWVSNVMHQKDTGGTVAGSYCTNAEDVYWEPPMFPPMKIVSGGEISSEKEEIYRRQSRTPKHLAMDLRAGIAGVNGARERIRGLIDQYGAPAVKGSIRALLDDGESAFEETLSKIPDGTWTERAYQERAISGDDGVYRMQLTLEKEGAQLTFRNDGTEDQVGAISQPFAAWRGGILSMANLLLQPEQMGATGGMMRSITFEPVPGTLSCPDFGAAVSSAGLYANELSCSMANSVIAKMLLSADDEKLTNRAMAATQAQWQNTISQGTTQDGDYYIAPMLDGMIGATPARPDRDGDFADGHIWIPEGKGPNVEAYERDWPLLYLYRGEHRDTAGAGKRRGGNGGKLAYIRHGGTMTADVYSTEGIPKTPGLLGGFPGSRGETNVLRESDVHDTLAAGTLPTDLDDISGEKDLLVGKGDPVEIDDETVVEWWWGSCAGYGDPLTRELDRVEADVRAGRISSEHAAETYGAIIIDDTIDESASAARRDELKAARLERADAGSTDDYDADGDAARLQIGDQLVLSGDIVQCAHCNEALGHTDENFKQNLGIERADIQDAGPHYIDPARFINKDMEFRKFYCPNCGALLFTETARADDPILDEFTVTRHATNPTD